jgi:hypothetical protein
VSSDIVSVIRLPLRTNNLGVGTGAISYTVNYVFNGVFTRQGHISISAYLSTINSSEEYTSSTTSNNSMLLDFTVAIVNNTIVISYTNPIADNAGTFSYSYTAVS